MGTRSVWREVQGARYRDAKMWGHKINGRLRWSAKSRDEKYNAYCGSAKYNSEKCIAQSTGAYNVERKVRG